MVTDIDVEESMQLKGAVFVDVRSPEEYEKGHIPGAINVALFENLERREIGIIYRQQGPEPARKRGLELVGPKLSRLVEDIAALGERGPVVIYCWRGGERSQAVARILEIMGVDCYRLRGGYKAFRRYVLKKLDELPKGRVVNLHGLTGVGKTAIIKKMREMGYPSIDLEGLACHRGSVFGGIGMAEQPSQKQFDSLLMAELCRLKGYGYVIVESESKKIGRLFLPDRLFTLMQEGVHILIYDTLANRVSRLVDEYVKDDENIAEKILVSLQGLERFIGKRKVNQLKTLIEEGEFREAARLLLVEYYDPLYGYKDGPDEKFAFSVCGQYPEEAARLIGQWLHEHMEGVALHERPGGKV